jgi:hypothetical protein
MIFTCEMLDTVRFKHNFDFMCSIVKELISYIIEDYIYTPDVLRIGCGSFHKKFLNICLDLYTKEYLT